MDKNFDTSFIPQRPIFKQEGGMVRHESIPVVTLVSFAIFFAALILTGATFFFDKKEKAAVATLEAQLASTKDSYNPQAIEELKEISARLKYAKDVVDHHVALSPVLDFLQATTLKSVYYEAMDMKKTEKDGYILTLKGKAPNYGLLYSQIEEFRAEPRLRSVVVTETNLEEQTGKAAFSVDLALSPEILKYDPLAQNGSVPQTQAPGATSTLPGVR